LHLKETLMTTKKAQATANSRKPARSNEAPQPKKRARTGEKYRTLILFGLDPDKKPRAAWFVGDELGLLAKAADAMDLIMCDAKTPKLQELVRKLPAGRLGASGTTFVPYVRQDLYDQLVEAAGSEAQGPTSPPTVDGPPRTFDDIAPGHLVIAQESLEFGWWEAIVFKRDGDVLTLRYRDYPRLPKFQRARTAIALLSPSAN
jgi:hypothetical protein